MSRRRTFTGLLLATAGAMVLGVGAVAADNFPSQPITLIVPWAAGGGSDISMRIVADAAERYLGQPVVVVNRPGAGGAEGTREIAAATPDGYTIGMVGSGLIARHYGNPNANDYNEIQPIVYFGADPGALSARADLGFETVADFVEAAKADPGGLRNGNDQPGGSSYINASVLEARLDIELTKVPYQGFAPTVAALLAGEIETATVPVPDVIEHHNAGSVVLLGVADTQRHFMAPDVPTFQEQGFDITVGSWRLIVAPRGIPEDRLDRLEEALLQTLSDPDFVARANAAGFAVDPKGRAETEAFVKEYDDLLYPVLREAGMVRVRARD